MNSSRRLTVLLALVASLGACASQPGEVAAKPEVQLRDVRVIGLGFRNQTFLLSFDLKNPNPYPLPVNHISYAIRLDGQRFASGQTESDILVPAQGDAEFAISVELDLLSTAPRLLSIMREGARRDIPYQLKGELGIAMPTTPTVSYQGDGLVRLNAGGF